MVNSANDGLELEALEAVLAPADGDGSTTAIAKQAPDTIATPLANETTAAYSHGEIAPQSVTNQTVADTTTGETAVSKTVALATEIALASIPTITTQGEGNAKATGNPYIRLRLDDNHLAAVNTDQAQEVLVIPQQRLTVMPNMPAAVMGLLNHRSRIFWVLDLPQLFGLTPLDPRSPDYHLAILRVNDKSIGLAVKEVQGVTRFSTETIQSALDHQLSPGLIPYLKGCTPQEEEMLLVLDAEAISSYSGYLA